MELAHPLIEKINVIGGFVVAMLSYFLGVHWVLFAGFLVLNVIDWVTGWMKSTLTNKTNSSKGAKGVLKKLGYWIMILLSFSASALFIEIGQTIGVDLQITTLLGYFVLASLILNEIRSIIENFVEAGYKVPGILTKGLQVAEKIIEKENAIGTLFIDTSEEESDTYHFHYDAPMEELKDKDTVTLKVDSNVRLTYDENGELKIEKKDSQE